MYNRRTFILTLCYCVSLQLADEKLREHWVSNCPELREVKSRQMERLTHEEWEHQKERKQKVSIID